MWEPVFGRETRRIEIELNQEMFVLRVNGVVGWWRWKVGWTDRNAGVNWLNWSFQAVKVWFWRFVSMLDECIKDILSESLLDI